MSLNLLKSAYDKLLHDVYNIIKNYNSIIIDMILYIIELYLKKKLFD